MVFEEFIYTGLVVGLMVFETFTRYAGLAVGLKPSATRCEARLRGRERGNCSKTMSRRAEVNAPRQTRVDARLAAGL